jgi:hypothetical protein
MRTIGEKNNVGINMMAQKAKEALSFARLKAHITCGLILIVTGSERSQVLELEPTIGRFIVFSAVTIATTSFGEVGRKIKHSFDEGV